MKRAVVAWAAAAAVPVALVAATGTAREARPRAAPPGVVSVVVAGPGRTSVSATGFVVGGGRIVTVLHALGTGGRIQVRGAGGTHSAARVATRDPRSDLAVLVAERPVAALAGAAPGGVRLLAADRGTVRAAATVVRRRLSARVAEPFGRRIHVRDALELEVAARAGDSGAPVVDPEGRILGVLFARSRLRPRTAYATDAGAVARLVGDPARPASRPAPSRKV